MKCSLYCCDGAATHLLVYRGGAIPYCLVDGENARGDMLPVDVIGLIPVVADRNLAQLCEQKQEAVDLAKRHMRAVSEYVNARLERRA